MEKIFVACFAILLLGLSCGFAFGLRFAPAVAAGMALIVWTAGVSVVGCITGFKSLKGSQFHKIVDDKTSILLTLKLGPFSYTVEVPEIEEREEKQP